MLKVIYTSYFKNGGSKPPPYRESCKIHCFLIWDDVGIVPYELEAVYTVISVKPCRGGVSPPAGRETRPPQRKTNITINSRIFLCNFYISLLKKS